MNNDDCRKTGLPTEAPQDVGEALSGTAAGSGKNTIKLLSGRLGKAIMISCGMALAGCELPQICAAPAPEAGEIDLSTPNRPETRPFINILAQNPQLAGVRNRLASMHFSRTHQPESGYQILMDILANGFDPGQDYRVNKAYLAERLKNVDTASQIYIVRVATSLWVEANNLVPWSLKDYSEYEIETLFYVPNLLGTGPNCRPSISVHNQNDPEGMGDYPAETSAEPELELEAAYQLVTMALKLKGQDKNESIVHSVRWVKGNFFHTYQNDNDTWWNFELYRDGRPESEAKGSFAGHAYYEPASLDRLFEERAVGCHEPVVVLAGLLRSLNIPAMNVKIEGHGVTYLPTLDRYVHGDNLVCDNTYPTEMVMFSPAEIMQNIETIPMMSKYLGSQAIARYGELDSEYFRYIRIGRQEESIYLISFGRPITNPEVLADVQRELPHFHIEMGTDGQSHSVSVPIKTLLDLSYSTKDIWDPTAGSGGL